MKRVLLDTNIYGLILEKEEPEKFRNLIRSSDARIYGLGVIRNELRAVARGVVDGINLRMDLLRLYDSITKNRELESGKKAEEIADSYHMAYRQLGGITSGRKMRNDFLAVAAASLHNLDIVVSEDNATMLNKIALRAYSIVNAVLKLKMPEFIGYEKFKSGLKK